MPIDVGLDLVSVQDVEASLHGEHGRRYLARIYTEQEVADCRGSAGDVDAVRLAGRFAAKEATLKVISSGEDGISMRDIEVRREASGRVHLELHGAAADLAAGLGVQELALSITHEAGFAAAVVVATRAPAS
jgi:holo-[acyl-carrier protein] synthase